jgi:hypothetical protein
VLDRFPNRPAHLQPLIEPAAEFSDQAHGGLTIVVFAVGLPVVGISPACMKSFPSSTLWRYWKRPRGGGPAAQDPSA